MADHLEDTDHTLASGSIKDDRIRQTYSNLFYLLQAKPHYIARLARHVSIADIDGLLQTVMFTLYGNQYESREEHLLLSMFEVCLSLSIIFVSSLSFVLFILFHFFLLYLTIIILLSLIPVCFKSRIRKCY